MVEELAHRYHQLAALTARVARAAAELEAVRPELDQVRGVEATEIEELADRLQALHVLLANEVEKAWNATEAAARSARRSVLLGRVHDAVSAETILPDVGPEDSWLRLGDPDYEPPSGPERK